MASSESFLPELAAFLGTRLSDPPADSYSHRVMTDNVLARRKLMEEAFEVCLELGAADVDAGRLAEEAADVVFHLVAALTGAGVPWDAVEAELRGRHGGAAS